MTRVECLKGLSVRIQNLRERIASAEEESPIGEEENELLCLEQKLETLTGGSDRGRKKSYG
jgi:hypothetical protein